MLFLARKGSPFETAPTATTITTSSVKKVTNLYGDGAWFPSPVSYDVTRAKLERALLVHKDHAKRHGHEQIILRTNLFGNRVNNAYTKIGNLLEQNLMEMSKGPSAGAKWLFWHDADTVILNSKVSLDVFVPDVAGIENAHLLYTVDGNGLNAGVFFIRVGEWTSLFLASVLSLARPFGMAPYDKWEQSAMVEVLKEDYYGKEAVQVPKYWFNEYPDLQLKNGTTNDFINGIKPGTFMVHMAGASKYEEGKFDYYLSIAQNSDPAWHNTSVVDKLREEVKTFWSGRSVSQ